MDETRDPLDELEGMAESAGSNFRHVEALAANVLEEIAGEDDEPLVLMMALTLALVRATGGDDDLLNMAVNLIDTYLELEDDDDEGDESES